MRGFVGRLWKSSYLFPALIVALSACAKLALLSSRELWLDETYSAFEAHLPFREMFHFSLGDVHPPLFAIVLWTWAHVAGDTQVRLRLLSVLLNIVSMVVMVFLARRVLGPRFGTYAVALYAFSPMLLVYSLEVRSYMLFVTVMVCLLLVHWIVAVEHDDSRRYLVAYGLLASVLFYIHYLAIFVLFGLFVHWVISSGLARSRVLKLYAVVVMVALIAASGVALLQHQYRLKVELDKRLRVSRTDPAALTYKSGEPENSNSLHVRVALAKSSATISGIYPAREPALLLLCVIPIVCVFVGIAVLLFRGDAVCSLFVVVAASVVAGVFRLHLSNVRYLLPLVPILSLAMARVIQFLTETRRWRVAGQILGVVLVVLYLAGFTRQALRPRGRPWQNLLNAIAQRYKPGDEVVFDALYAQVPFDYFARHQNFQPAETGFPISVYEWWGKQPHTAWGGPVITQVDLNKFLGVASQAKTVWVVSYENDYYDPQQKLIERLSEMGSATEIPLPSDPESQGSDSGTDLRLIGVTLR
jgi:uncharacterized membrane protein